MSIPKIVKIDDARINRTMTYKLIGTTGNNLLIYENIKTGRKCCWNKQDFAHLNKDVVRITSTKYYKEKME